MLSASRAPPAGSRLGGGDDRAREFEHRPRSSSVTSTWIARAVPLFATVHRPSFGPRLPPLAIHTPRNTTAAVKPKTKSVTARFVRDGNRDLEETVQSITTPPASMTASGIANAIAHPARRVNGRCHLKVGRHSRVPGFPSAFAARAWSSPARWSMFTDCSKRWLGAERCARELCGARTADCSPFWCELRLRRSGRGARG